MKNTLHLKAAEVKGFTRKLSLPPVLPGAGCSYCDIFIAGPLPIRKELPLSSAFPAVKVRQTDSLDEAYKRVIQAFTERRFEIAECPPDAEWAQVARLFAVPHDGAYYLCIVNTRAFTEDEENAFLGRLSDFCGNLIDKRPIYFKGFSPVMYSPVMRYMLSDATRFMVVLTCNNFMNHQPEVTPEDPARIAKATLNFFAPLACRLPQGTPLPKFVDEMVVKVLRNEKDPDKDDTGFKPCGALDCLGFVVGEILRQRVSEEKNLSAEWVTSPNGLMVKISAKVSKGFFSKAEQVDLLWGNPCGKVYKLFESGMADSTECLVNSTIAMVRHQMEEKGIA